jgi:hypothetical protein
VVIRLQGGVLRRCAQSIHEIGEKNITVAQPLTRPCLMSGCDNSLSQ